jgi:hypothetical protein
MQAFVSTSSQDTGFVESNVFPALEATGITPWIYKAAIPGSNWIESVFDQIRDGDWFVVVLTTPYAASVYEKRGACYHELLWILDQVMTSRRRCRLVVLWRSGNLPDMLRTWQAVDVREDLGRMEAEFRRAADSDRTADQRVAGARVVLNGKPASPAKPEVRGPGDLPDLAKYNFSRIAQKYSRSMVAGRPMQRDNGEVLLRLLARLIKDGRVRLPEAWLDSGCGTGLMAMLCDQLKGSRDFGWLRQAKVRVGMDYSPQMISIAGNLELGDGDGYTHVLDGDCRWFGSDTLMAGTGLPRVDLIFMNNVLHWLFTDEGIERALRQAYEMLDRGGGCVAASIAGLGTGRDFYRAYQAELDERLERRERDKWRVHIDNPIGLQSLDCVVDVARRCRFRIERAQLMYEPKEYDSTDDYVRDVRAYGEEVLMAPLFGLSADEREKVWSSVADRFRELHRAKHNQVSYVHDQFMIYLIAVRHD